MKLALLNTSIITTDGTYSLETISLEQAQQLVQAAELDSAIGHQSTADAMTELLNVPVNMHRQMFEQEIGQQALVFKLNGRPPEGKIMTREDLDTMGYSWKVLTRHS